ncbi:uncharacterized protein LACBIDRAFT_294023 [Laccaria bicolor S238N-H82]|uniref:Predicted protein n=1 Tax=Laccaria bicolor (strain S238N-H82 / ATCC MYA-4686) TaxID=486041 RepID=B0D8K0_LACBS|nr:uncharacterized protein LACBIDRAFT_294023 [Laccaria bicolor S238N-H82]EDR09087.1 predicted protein [Laccaria bicolor S238N-H82]|eukprot:XP_001880400.1 predicted protein [Laccaria bicolor S238N-H82]
MSTAKYTETWLSGPLDTSFYTRTYAPPPSTPPKAALVFLHGFAEHVGRYTHFHPLLAERGITVFAYDQRGFGLTAQDTEGKKSKGSAYGKTSWKDQMRDIDWAISHVKETFKGLPVFLMGHSMGGGEVLSYAARPDHSQTNISSLSGIIATSPLISQTTPAPKLLKWIGGKLSVLAPHSLIPADVKAEELSHDADSNEAYLKDPLIKQSGSLKGIHDMLSRGESLLHTAHKDWPKDLPAFIIHGTEDKVTCHKASQTFHDKIPALKKKITLFPGGYHELQNEPDGVQEKLADEIKTFVDEHASSAADVEPSSETETPSKDAAGATTVEKAKM